MPQSIPGIIPPPAWLTDMTDSSYLDAVSAALPFGALPPPLSVRMEVNPARWSEVFLFVDGGPPGTMYDIYWGDPGVVAPEGVYPPGTGFSQDSFTPGDDGPYRNWNYITGVTGGEAVTAVVSPSNGGPVYVVNCFLGRPPFDFTAAKGANARDVRITFVNPPAGKAITTNWGEPDSEDTGFPGATFAQWSYGADGDYTITCTPEGGTPVQHTVTVPMTPPA
jgi:hypothetical protein